MSINILSTGLVVVAVVVLYAILHPASQPHLEEYTKTDIYMMNNAIDSSKLYLRASFDYSVHQAVYDIAKNGGLSRTVKNQWDRVLEESEFVSNVKKEILKNMNSYTAKGYRFLDMPSLVRLPKYGDKNIELTESDEGTRISLTGWNLEVSKRDEQEVIILESSSGMENLYEIDLFGMYKKAKQFYGQVNKSCDAVVNETKNEGGFEIEIEVLDKVSAGSTCRATAGAQKTAQRNML